MSEIKNWPPKNEIDLIAEVHHQTEVRLQEENAHKTHIHHDDSKLLNGLSHAAGTSHDNIGKIAAVHDHSNAHSRSKECQREHSHNDDSKLLNALGHAAGTGNDEISKIAAVHDESL